MIVILIYGYAKDYMYSNDGTLMIRTRIPSIHGPYKRTDAKGKVIRNYVDDSELPYYPSLLLPHLPNEGEVVCLSEMDNNSSEWIVIGLTGGNYYSGVTNT